MIYKTALITGASSGIGMELARVFAGRGINLVVTARRTDQLNRLKQELESAHETKVSVITADLSNTQEAQQLFDFCKSENITISYLINNAGFGHLGNFAETDTGLAMDMINVNIASLTLLTRLFLPDMLKNGYGRIMNVASTAAFQPGPGMSVYYASKAYILHLSEGLATELKGTGITVTALCPGPTTSGFQQVANMDGVRLFRGRKLPTSAEVAEYGYRAMKEGKTVAVHGMLNYILANSVRFSPRALTRTVVTMLHRK